MSSPYIILGNRPLDQWKVTELKEELKRRKLTIKGLKEDLVKRLDEAVRIEWESDKESTDISKVNQSELPSDQAMTDSIISGRADDLMDVRFNMIEKVQGNPENEIDDHRGSLGEGKVVDSDVVTVGLQGEQVSQFTTVETAVVVSETIESVTALSESHLLSNETNDDGDSNEGLGHDGLVPPQEDVSPDDGDSNEGLGHDGLVPPQEDVTSDDGDSNEGLGHDGLVPPQEDVTPDDGYSNEGLGHGGLVPPQEDVTPDLSDPNSQLPQIKESSMSVLPPSGLSLQSSETQNEAMDSLVQLENDDSKCPQPDHNAQPLKYQVSEVDPDLGSQVISVSVSTESVSIIEKNELKVDVIADNVKLELDVDHEMVHPPPSSVVPDGGESHPMDVEEPLDKKVSLEETSSSNAGNVDSLKNIDSDDLGPEKLSLDRSSGDDSMEEDILECKQMECKSTSNQTGDRVEKSQLHIVEEDIIVDVVGVDKPVQTEVANAENKMFAALTSGKRKFNGNDKEAVANNVTAKMPRRWNVEGLIGSEPKIGNFGTPTTPKDLSQVSQTSTNRFTRSDSTFNEAPKERIVPPSSKPPSNSLRIDRFLRPFTLKAVQELLGKTGTITSFWMDHIKTHCYVSYSSVEEAVETRTAVYNLQWPPNGGRMLVAEFVDPQEVKTRVEAPPASPATPSSSSTPTFSSAQPPAQPQPSPRQQIPRQLLPPPSLPPPLANAPSVRKRPHPAREPLPREQLLPARDRVNLPPPPPLPEKVDPPIVTLDDLFRKTNATPRIYYMPLSDELVAAKLKAQGKNV